MKKIAKTSWGKSAEWYKKLLSEEGTYQKEVILPNLLRLLDIQKNEVILDLACGTGFFSNEFLKKGAKVIGADVSEELIKIAKSQAAGYPKSQAFYFVSSADNLRVLKDESVDKIAIVLAIQNIDNIQGVFAECQRVLKSGGRMFLVLNHPAFRIPKESEWGWDPKKKVQYRRIDRYLSEFKAKIQMRPGEKPSEHTISFHRPFQVYFKALRKGGFCVSGLEEWISHKKSERGPRQSAEDQARKEIPLFLFLEAIKK